MCLDHFGTPLRNLRPSIVSRPLLYEEIIQHGTSRENHPYPRNIWVALVHLNGGLVREPAYSGLNAYEISIEAIGLDAMS